MRVLVVSKSPKGLRALEWQVRGTDDAEPFRYLKSRSGRRRNVDDYAAQDD